MFRTSMAPINAFVRHLDFDAQDHGEGGDFAETRLESPKIANAVKIDASICSYILEHFRALTIPTWTSSNSIGI